MNVHNGFEQQVLMQQIINYGQRWPAGLEDLCE